MGGRAAEILVFDEMTTGAKQDIQTSTDIARNMVCDWGMSDELGPLAYGKKQEQIFLGREHSQSRDYSDSVAMTIDNEVKKLVTSAYNRALKLLTDNRDKLEMFAKALLEYETLSLKDIQSLMDSGDVTDALKRRDIPGPESGSLSSKPGNESPRPRGSSRPSPPDLAPGEA